jgi:hypothetical protein
MTDPLSWRERVFLELRSVSVTAARTRSKLGAAKNKKGFLKSLVVFNDDDGGAAAPASSFGVGLRVVDR